MTLKIFPYALALLFAITTYIEYDKDPRVVTNTQTQVIDHIHTVTITVREPNGETKTTTTTDDNKDTKELIAYKQINVDKNNFALSYGMDFQQTIPRPVYGLHITREFIGPFTLGLYGLTNKTIGVTVGYDF